MAAIAKLSPTHDAIARWILANPGPRLVTRCADYFGYTIAWMSTVMNSDAFRAHLATLNESADAAVIADIPAKMRGVASLALDGLAEQCARAIEDPIPLHRDFLRETADTVLHRLGYAPEKKSQGPAAGTIINNNVVLPVDPALLAAARDRFNQLAEVKREPLPAPAEQLIVDAP